MKNCLLLSAACLFFCGLGQEAEASGFGLKLSSSKLAARSHAGSAVESEILASFTNPANLIQLSGYEAGIMGTAVIPHVKFGGWTTNPTNINQRADGNCHRQVGVRAIVPSFGVGARLHDRLSFGIWVGAPFGLKMNYGSNWGGNRYVVKSGLQTFNITPSLAVKLHDMVSIGAGFQAQQSKVKLTSRASSSTLFGGVLPLPQQVLNLSKTRQEVKGDDWAYGWTAGLLLQPLKCFKLGFSYRSDIHTHVKGHLRFKNIPSAANFVGNPLLQAVAASVAAQLTKTTARANIKYPKIFTLSGSWDITNRFTFLFDVVRTNWSSIKNIVIKTPGNPQKGLIQQKWRDAWFFSGGFDFKANDCWTLHGGIGWDQTPTRNKYRVPGIPDNNKWWFALGTSVDITQKLSMTLGFGHERFKNASVNLRQSNPGNGAPSAKGNLKGKIREHVELVTLQFNVKF